MALKKLVVGNWKMNGQKNQLSEIKAISDKAMLYNDINVVICVPATLIEPAANIAPTLSIGAQDCHSSEKGAHTGCLSAAMLFECGAEYIIVGHSERREDQNESNDDVKAKAISVLKTDMHAILCIGESAAQRDSGDAVEIVIDQLLKSLPSIEEIGAVFDGAVFDGTSFSVAYEPIWAIGTGRIPSLEDVRQMHMAIRGALVEYYGKIGDNIHILYGGSMNGGNAKELMMIDNVDGGLVGGASLTAEKFVPVMEGGST